MADAITVQIDPTVELPNRYLGSGEDGPQYGPVTLYDAVVDAAARIVSAGVSKEARVAIRKAVDQEYREGIKSAIADAIREAVETPRLPTDNWGSELHGRDPITVRQQVVELARKELTLQNGNRSSYDSNAFTKLIRDEVGKAVREDLQEELAAARAKVRDAVKANAADLIAKASLGERF